MIDILNALADFPEAYGVDFVSWYCGLAVVCIIAFIIRMLFFGGRFK